jgi:MFS family permease
MKVEMSKTKQILCLVAIMLTNIAVMADLVIIPVISNIYRAFPDDMQIVNYIISGPMLVIVGSSLLATFLLRVFSKKTVIVAGGVIFTVGAVAGVAINNVFFIALMRTLVGVGAGLVNVVAVALIADIYDDKTVRAKMTGYYNASMSFIGMAFSYISGILAKDGVWQESFKCYWAAFPMLIMLIIFIPSIKRETIEETGGNAANREKTPKEPFGWRYWVMAASWLVMNIIFGATVLYYLSAYIVENNLGDSSFTGLAASVKSIVGLLMGLGFGFIYSKLKRQTNTVCCLVSAVCLVIMVAAPSPISALVVGTIAGCAYKVAFSYEYVHGFEIVPVSRIDDAVAVTTAVYGIGSFASTYFVTLLMGIMKTQKATGTWAVPIVIFVLLAAVELITSIKEKSLKTA